MWKRVSFILLSSATWTACIPEPTPCVSKTETHDIRADERGALVYKGGEKLTFLRLPQNDTLVMQGTPLTHDYITYASESECPQYTRTEAFAIDFIGFVNGDKYVLSCKQYLVNDGVTLSQLSCKLSTAGIESAYSRGAGSLLVPSRLISDTIRGVIYMELLLMSLITPYQADSLVYDRETGVVQIGHFLKGEKLELVSKQ
jgi:hypothetical protein